MTIKSLFDVLIGIIPKSLNFLYEFKIYGQVNLLGVLVAFAVIGMLMLRLVPRGSK